MAQYMSEESPSPTVSIGMPVYNADGFLRDAIDSILSQTFNDFELIISDNASTDLTASICREYARLDTRVRYIRQRENIGATANFYAVLKEAVGTYFMWAAGDDKCEPRFVEDLLAVLEQHEDVVLAMCDVRNISEDGSALGISRLDNIRISDVIREWDKVRLRFFENPTSHVFFAVYGLFRTPLLRDIDLNYRGLVKYSSGAEIPLLAQVAIRGKIASIPSVQKTYRHHSNSLFATEQGLGNVGMRLRNLCNISSCLVRIVVNSRLPAGDKSSALLAIFVSGARKISGFLVRRLAAALSIQVGPR
jgi:glycosyltransferase involved in cell wall biosynthesis